MLSFIIIVRVTVFLSCVGVCFFLSGRYEQPGDNDLSLVLIAGREPDVVPSGPSSIFMFVHVYSY